MVEGSIVQPGEAKPLISVIIPEPFDDPRADIAFLRDWVGQSCDEPFEVIMVAAPGRPDFISAVERILRPTDRLILAELSHEIEGYEIGARAAEGRWIFITENHVRPERDCLREVLAFLADGASGACVVNSASVPGPKIAHAEGACFLWQMRQQDPAQMSLQIRGFAVSLEAFNRHGGLDARYRTYAPAILSHRLATAGIKVRLLDKHLIRHVNCQTFQSFFADIRDTTIGECIFADERRYQSASPVPIPWRRGFDWGTARALGQMALFPDRRIGRRERLRAALRLPRDVIRLACESLIATRIRWMMAYTHCHWLRLRFLLARSGSDGELTRFVSMWQEIVRTVRLEYAAGRQRRAEGVPTAITMADMSNDQMGGFHGLECHAGRSFRWSQPVAEIAIALPVASHRFTIDTGGLRGDAAGLPLRLFVNRNRISPAEITADRNLILFTAPAKCIVNGGETRITILTEPLQEPRQFGGQKGRKLGLPIFDFRAEAENVSGSGPSQT